MTDSVKVGLFRTDPLDFEADDSLKTLSKMSSLDRTIPRPLQHRLMAVARAKDNGLSLWILRKDDLNLHENGVIRPWDLPVDVAEGSFFHFHADGVVTMIAPGHSPRTTALSAYLLDRTAADVTLNPIINTQKGAHVASIDEVKRIEIVVTGHSVPLLREVNESLGDAVQDLTTVTGSSKMRLVFDGTDKESRDGMWGKMKGSVRDLADRADLSLLKSARVYVKGELNGEEQIDLLKDRIVYQVEVPAVGLTEDTAVDVATQAYDRFREEFGGLSG